MERRGDLPGGRGRMVGSRAPGCRCAELLTSSSTIESAASTAEMVKAAWCGGTVDRSQTEGMPPGGREETAKVTSWGGGRVKGVPLGRQRVEEVPPACRVKVSSLREVVVMMGGGSA